MLLGHWALLRFVVAWAARGLPQSEVRGLSARYLPRRAGSLTLHGFAFHPLDVAPVRQPAPDGTAFTYIDYERDSEGISESLTWSQVYRRTLNVAAEVRRHAAIGDRAVILAPQGLDYIVAFLGALQAGLIAVPLSAPLGGASDERVDAVVRDAKPNVVLTTSAIMGDVVPRVTPPPGIASPPTVAVDQLDLDSPIRSNIVDDSLQTTAYLQYTSGSTRTPAGVMITYKNILANFQQMISAYFADTGAVPPLDLFIMSWLPFYHDMGLVLGVCAPIIVGCGAVLTSPVAFLQRPARWLQLMAREGQAFSAAPNFAFELTAAKAIDDDLAGLDLGRIKTILCGSERVHPATLKRFVDRFSRFNLREFAIRPAYGLAEATVYVATSQAGQPQKSVTSNPTNFPLGRPSRAQPGRAQLWSVTRCRNHPLFGSSIPTPIPSAHPEQSVRSGYTATMSPAAIGKSLTRLNAPSEEHWSLPRPAHP